MPEKLYKMCECRACSMRFFTPPFHHSSPVHCPKCGDFMDVVKLNNVKIDHNYVHSPWTDYEDEIVIKGKRKGLMNKEIAEQLPGRDVKGVHMRVYRLRQRGLIY